MSSFSISSCGNDYLTVTYYMNVKFACELNIKQCNLCTCSHSGTFKSLGATSSSKRNSVSTVDHTSLRTSLTGGGQSLIPISEHLAHRVSLTGAQSYTMNFSDHPLMTRTTTTTTTGHSGTDHQGQRTSTMLASLSSSVNADGRKQMTASTSKSKAMTTTTTGVRKKQSGSDKRDASRLHLPSVQRSSEGS